MRIDQRIELLSILWTFNASQKVLIVFILSTHE